MLMSKVIQNRYKPDYVLPPGETLAETLDAIGMTQVDLAERTGHARKTINEIIRGKAALTPETALQLERVLGVPASFWNNLERDYREGVARLEEQIQLMNQVTWLGNFPLRAMVARGWIELRKDPIQMLKEVLNFFGVASRELWDEKWLAADASFRKSPAFECNPYAVAAWLRRGEIGAQGVVCRPFDKAKFRAALEQIRLLTVKEPRKALSETTQLCAEVGVAVVVVPELPGTHINGAAKWLTPTKALIQLSCRHNREDHLWFSFFHEVAHLLQGGKRGAFVDAENETGAQEEKANNFAARTLVPESDLRAFLAGVTVGRISKAAIERFAKKIGIAPGIVVGRLQHDGLLPPSHCNDLKRTIA
jgi:addiction module HigA family antidote